MGPLRRRGSRRVSVKQKGRILITLIEHFPLQNNLVKMSVIARLERNGLVSRYTL